MKKLVLTTLLAGMLAAGTVTADSPSYNKRHFDRYPAHEMPKHSYQHQTKQPPHRSTHGRNDHRYEHDRRGDSRHEYRHDHHRNDRGRNGFRPSYVHGYHRYDEGHGRRIHDERGGNDAIGEMVVGGLLGGIVGNSFASEGYRTQGVIFGALAGTAIGYAIGKD